MSFNAVSVVRYNSSNIPKNFKNNKVWFCDTCFIAHSMKDKSNSFKIRVALHEKGMPLGFNINVHAELIKLTRFELIEHAIISMPATTKNKKHKALYESYKSRKITQQKLIKEILRLDFQFVQSVIGRNGELLRAEVAKALTGLTYFGAKEGVTAKWEDAYSLMGKTCLDSSDAMILNIVASNDNFAGIITTDNDFEHVKNYKDSPRGFEIWIAKI